MMTEILVYRGVLLMKKVIVVLILINFSLSAMKRPGQEIEEVVPKVPKKELSQEVQEKIKLVRELAEKGEFSDEISAEILKNLAKVKVRGATEEQKLFNAIANIRNFMEAFPQFYGDVPINSAIIEELAKHYFPNGQIKVAIALATTGSGQWLALYVGNDMARKKIAGHELIYAAEYGKLATIRFIFIIFLRLLMKKIVVKNSSLMYAAESGYIAEVDRLLQVPGINVNAQNL